MASLKCSNCGFGIHYHDEPNGIEYTAFSTELWNSFAKTDKPIIRYVLDGDDDFLCVWRCPECGCIHTFQAYQSTLKQAYVPCSENVIPNGARKYLVFIDYLFDDVSEKGLTAEEFINSGEYPTDSFFYAMVADNSVIVYEDEACTKPVKYFTAIETKTA